jgi:protoporphyrinogen IX oxidase
MSLFFPDCTNMFAYIKALHIIFVVTWFAGLFYIVRLFIYNREAQDKPEQEREILQSQFKVMIRRLWFGITWPSCILTLIFGTWLTVLYGSIPSWLAVKIGFVVGLLLYHLSIHLIYEKQIANIFNYTSLQLRMWNEVATLFLFAIVFLVVVKHEISFVWGVAALLTLFLVLKVGITLYKYLRAQ